MYPIPNDLPPHLWKEWEKASEKAEADAEIERLECQLAASREREAIAEKALKDVRELADNHPNDAGVMIARLRAIWNAAQQALDAMKGGA